MVMGLSPVYKFYHIYLTNKSFETSTCEVTSQTHCQLFCTGETLNWSLPRMSVCKFTRCLHKSSKCLCCTHAPRQQTIFFKRSKHELTRLHICVFTCLVSAFVQSWIILNQRSVSSTITHFIGLTWLLSPLMCRRAPINYNCKFINLNIYMFINVYSLFIYLSPHKNYTQTVVSLQLVYHCEQQPLSVTGSLQVTVLLTYLSPLYCCTFSSA